MRKKKGTRAQHVTDEEGKKKRGLSVISFLTSSVRSSLLAISTATERVVVEEEDEGEGEGVSLLSPLLLLARLLGCGGGLIIIFFSFWKRKGQRERVKVEE